jgi:hypothetical protein
MNGLQVVCNDIFPINLDGSTIDYLCDSDPNSEGAKETDEFLYRYGLVCYHGHRRSHGIHGEKPDCNLYG